MTDEFDPNWPHGHVTRNGCKARILATDIKGDLPIAAAIEDEDFNEWVGSFRKDGQSCAYKSECDIINAPVPKRKFTFWVNVYPETINKQWSIALHNDKKYADMMAGVQRIACIKIEFEEGEGL